MERLWCMDFTYLFLKDGRKWYNYPIIDLYDHSVVVSVNGREITSQLAIEALKKALFSKPRLRKPLILHSD